jgi:hypothetical protein
MLVAPRGAALISRSYSVLQSSRCGRTSLVAATPVGRDVTATAEVVGVEGRRVDFKVSASDGQEEIGKGNPSARIVIDLCSFNERLAQKSVSERVGTQRVCTAFSTLSRTVSAARFCSPLPSKS